MKVLLGKSKRWLLSVMGVLLTAIFPVLFLYFRNAGEAHLSDIASVLLIYTATSLALFTAVSLLIRNAEKAGIISVLFLLVLLNYRAIESAITAFIPSLHYWHIMPLICVLLLCAAWIIQQKLSEDLAKIIMPVLCAVFFALSVVNGVAATPAIIKRISAENEAKKQGETIGSASEYMPNFYFLLFDEYSTIPFMQKYFDYDNTEFLDNLEKLGFNISQSGHNDDNRTAYIMANIFQLEHVTEKTMTSEELFKLRSNNKVFPLLREAGYSIISPAGSNLYGLPNALGESSEVGTIGGKNAKTLLLGQTVLYPYISEVSNSTNEIILNQLAYLKDKNNFAKSNQFTLFHIELPHTPFRFDSDGNELPIISNSWDDLNLYLEQYIFTTKEMYEIVHQIVETDPSAIIWLLSDHSARASSAPDTYLKAFSMEDMTNFFSAVYYQGESLDIEGLSGINTLRGILNRLLDKQYEMIP